VEVVLADGLERVFGFSGPLEIPDADLPVEGPRYQHGLIPSIPVEAESLRRMAVQLGEMLPAVLIPVDIEFRVGPTGLAGDPSIGAHTQPHDLGVLRESGLDLDLSESELARLAVILVLRHVAEGFGLGRGQLQEQQGVAVDGVGADQAAGGVRKLHAVGVGGQLVREKQVVQERHVLLPDLVLLVELLAVVVGYRSLVHI
jgi:hypothetical protein